MMLDLLMLAALVACLGAVVMSPILFIYFSARGCRLIFRRKRKVVEYAKL